MTHKMTRNSYLVVCLLMLALAQIGQAKSHDVSPGMRIEDALVVVKTSIVAATGFNDPRKKEKHKELRAQDTLEYAGVTDDVRLNSLRRYLIRNTNFGVLSIWGIRGANARPYIVQSSAIAGIKKSTTIEELARMVIKDAGLPFLPYEKVAKITSECWRQVTRVRNMPPIDTKIHEDDELKPDKRDDLRECIIGEKFGIQSASIIDGEGDTYRYSPRYVQSGVQEIIDSKNTKYEDLIDYLYRNSTVDLSENLTPHVIVMDWILNAIGDCKEPSFPISTLCQRGVEPRNDIHIFEATTIEDVEKLIGRPIAESPPDSVKGFGGRGKADAATLPGAVKNIKVDRSDTIRQTADKIRRILEGKKQ